MQASIPALPVPGMASVSGLRVRNTRCSIPRVSSISAR